MSLLVKNDNQLGEREEYYRENIIFCSGLRVIVIVREASLPKSLPTNKLKCVDQMSGLHSQLC